jgi:hypothetical protein
MKKNFRNAIAQAGVITAGIYLLVFIVFLIAPLLPYTLLKALQPIGIIGLLMSPIAFLITLVSIFASATIETTTKRKIVLVIVCAMGAIMTGLQTIALVGFWRMGPINPG